MPTYIILSRWTNQGLQKIGESTSRLEAGKKVIRGGERKDKRVLPGNGSIRYGRDCRGTG
jgi:uncharacterized protein with GYD domain